MVSFFDVAGIFARQRCRRFVHESGVVVEIVEPHAGYKGYDRYYIGSISHDVKRRYIGWDRFEGALWDMEVDMESGWRKGE